MMPSSHQATPLSDQQKDLYLIHNNIAYRLDGRTGKTIWQHLVASRNQPNSRKIPKAVFHVLDRVMHVMLDFALYALDIETGQEIWQVLNFSDQAYQSMAVDSERVYLYANDTTVDNPLLARKKYTDSTYTQVDDPWLAWEQYTGLTSLSAINVTDGSIIWHNTTFHPLRDSLSEKGKPDVGFSVSNGTIYAIHGTPREHELRTEQIIITVELYALDAATGIIRWHFPLPHGYVGYPPLVAHGMVYLFSGMTIFGLDELTGKLIWEYTILTQLPRPSIRQLGIFNQTVVILSSGRQGIVDGKTHLDCYFALDAQTGKQRWVNREISSPGIQFCSSPSFLPVLGPHGPALLDVLSGQIIWETQEFHPLWVELTDENWICFYRYSLSQTIITSSSDLRHAVKQFKPRTTHLLSSCELPADLGAVMPIGVSNRLLYLELNINHSGDFISYAACNLTTGELVWSVDFPVLRPTTNLNTWPATAKPNLAPR